MKKRSKTKFWSLFAMLAAIISLFTVFTAAATTTKIFDIKFVNRQYDTLAEMELPISEINEYFGKTLEVKYEDGKYMIEDIGADYASLYNTLDYEDVELDLEGEYWVCEMQESEYNDESISHVVRFFGFNSLWDVSYIDGEPYDRVYLYDDNTNRALNVSLYSDYVETVYEVHGRRYVDCYADGVFTQQSVEYYFDGTNDYFFIYYNAEKEISYVELWSSGEETYFYYFPEDGWYINPYAEPEYATSAPVGYESADIQYFTALAPTNIDCTHPSYSPADCENPESCYMCGLPIEGSEALGHEWSGTINYGLKTCLTCGTVHEYAKIDNNGDKTHTITCYECDEIITEDCSGDSMYGYMRDAHWGICPCGLHFDKEPHSFDEKNIDAISVSSHWVLCDNEACNHKKPVSHVDSDSDGKCDDCSHIVSELFDVYVDGKGLKVGQYIDCYANVSDTKPVDGGYAHYDDGVLTLNDFVYDGEGAFTKAYLDSDSLYRAAIYITKEMTVRLVGESSVRAFSESELYYTDAIMSERSLIIDGDGSLVLFADNDGINVDYGDVTINSGSITLGRIEYDEFGNIVDDDEIGDDAIDIACGVLVINGGNVFVNSDDNSFDVTGNIFIFGGAIYMISGDDGFNAELDVEISGGNVTVLAEDHALDSDYGKIEISGGVVSLHSEEEYVISSEKDVIISGGEITVVSTENMGIFSYKGSFDMSGGKLHIFSNYYTGISAEKILVSDGELSIYSIAEPLRADAFDISGGSFGFDVSAYLNDGEKVSFDSADNMWSFPSGGGISIGIVIAIVAAVLVVGGIGAFVFVIKRKKAV